MTPGEQILLDAAAGGAGLDDLAAMAEDMVSRCAEPDTDSERDAARFRARFFGLTRLFQGHGRADGDLTPECLAAVQEVLDTLGKKAGPEDDRTAGRRRHDALETSDAVWCQAAASRVAGLGGGKAVFSL